ncbi:TonB-dependent siderophore receptor [Methylibium sp. Root1272]|uniref:TonB-dependent receptor n=1 Tax=Methylibium sp. Root1272 TaxID=1736441 RepID=UPI0006F9C830|nr:TonB-dependent receptor [Methylibium sp. Root1272]KQW76675.1 TonB-dependent receptor [Methylibium sp. Root1272]
MRTLAPVALAAAMACQLPIAHAQSDTPPAPTPADANATVTLPPITVKASADASAQGLSPAFPGGQVARGGRAGILGTKDNLDTPFSITSYTNELIQDRQARSVGDVLQNDPSVRVARGFGNFQESYFIRGFILSSDDVAYNGLYNLLPRQYIATELFERVEVLRGASAFLSGATPSGGGLGGSINLLPKRASNEDLNRVTVGAASGPQGSAAVDISRRFGPDQSTGLRLNAAYRDGDTAVDEEKARLGLVSLGADWRSRDVRLSGDIGFQDNRLKRTRSSVTLGDFLTPVTAMPAVPDNETNASQPWSYSNEKDVFGTLRGEVDLGADVTAWAAYGLRRSDEANSLANFTLLDPVSGDGYTYRFDNTREDRVDTGELGLRGKLRTGSVGHEWVVSASYFRLETKNAYLFDFGNQQATNLYRPVRSPEPAFSGGAGGGNDLASPALTARTRLTSLALGDTLSLLGDRFLLTLGARHQNLRIENYAYTTGVAAPVYDDSRVSPLVGAVYKATKQLSLYANYIEGLSKGDTAPAMANNPNAMLAPYVSKQKEIGAKYEADRLGLGAALFSTDKPRAVGGAPGTTFTAGGEDRHRGVELTAYGEAARGLRVLGGLTWLDAEQKETGSAATEGKRTLGIPRTQANLGVEWDVTGVQGFALDARVVRTGSVYADSANTLRVPGWTRVDVGARYLLDVQDRLVTLRARIDNLTDRDYWASVGGYPDAGYLNIGAPRTFVLSASVDF